MTQKSTSILRLLVIRIAIMAKTDMGVKVPNTVIKRHILRPMKSEIFPKSGHDIKDKIVWYRLGK
jgi:hypothetical protein